MEIAARRDALMRHDDRGVAVEWTLEPGDAAAARRIRHQVTACLARVAADAGGTRAVTDALADAEQVVAELLANVVTHATGPARVSLRWDGAHAVVRVTDTGPGFTAGDGGDADPLAERGRGLQLASRLALDLTIRPRGGGTEVTATLALPHATATPPG